MLNTGRVFNDLQSDEAGGDSHPITAGRNDQQMVDTDMLGSRDGAEERFGDVLPLKLSHRSDFFLGLDRCLHGS